MPSPYMIEQYDANFFYPPSMKKLGESKYREEGPHEPW